MHNELLVDLTGEDGPFWVEFIQKGIVRHMKQTDDPNHPSVESNLWVRELADAVWDRVKIFNDLTKVDENIVMAKTMSLIMALWTARLCRTKSYDPRRPVELRKMAIGRSIRFGLAMTSCLLDESQDHRMFPLPEWDPPFDPNAKNGDFV